MLHDRENLEAAIAAAKQSAVRSCGIYGSLLSHERADDLYSVLDGQLRIAAQLAKLESELFG